MIARATSIVEQAPSRAELPPLRLYDGRLGEDGMRVDVYQMPDGTFVGLTGLARHHERRPFVRTCKWIGCYRASETAELHAVNVARGTMAHPAPAPRIVEWTHRVDGRRAFPWLLVGSEVSHAG
jgi:hypothetical protein